MVVVGKQEMVAYKKGSTMTRSISLDNLRTKNPEKRKPKSMDDSALSCAEERAESLDRWQKDKLSKSLNMLESSFGQHGYVKKADSQDEFHLLPDRLLNTEELFNSNGDDEEFANVDEIDGPIVVPVKESHLDSPIDAAVLDGSTDIDHNMKVDSQLQATLEKRAAEIEECGAFQATPPVKIDWRLDCFGDLACEISDWFCASDFMLLQQTTSQFQRVIANSDKFLTDYSYAQAQIEKLLTDTNVSRNLLPLTYIVTGTYKYAESKEQQLQYIKKNAVLLAKHMPIIVNAFISIATICRDGKSNLKQHSRHLFYISTIIYMITCVLIEDRRKLHKHKVIEEKVIECFSKRKLLQFLTKYIEHWRWNSRLSMRLRNIIALFSKLLIFQFGDKPSHILAKRLLYKHHGLQYSTKNSAKLSISPLYYKAFREDLLSRFPSFDDLQSDLPKEIDNSNSLSQFLEIPRSKAKNPVNLSLPKPNQQLATPYPSPPQSPSLIPDEFTTKGRKSFQTNMAYPCLYPLSDDEGDGTFLDSKLPIDLGNHKFESEIPFSVQEAANLLTENLEIKLSVKQLWNEREMFMEAERGWSPTDQNNQFDYSSIKETEQKDVLRLMKRIDDFYKDCLPNFNSLIFVLLQTMQSNLGNVDYREADLLEQEKSEWLVSQLEMLRAKELSMKAAATILYLLLKWFKLNHMLKAEHLAVLLYDSRYISICSSLLEKYSENYMDKIFNRFASSSYNFWQECSKYNKAYSENMSTELLEPPLNDCILSSLALMLRVLMKVMGNKTQRLKELPLSIGIVFKKYYMVFNLDIYHPILRIIKELTPFKNKRWKSEHMELISGVYLHERLELTDNWVTGKDISSELTDACGQEIAMRALLQFYNFSHYQNSMTEMGYCQTSSNATDTILLAKEPE